MTLNYLQYLICHKTKPNQTLQIPPKSKNKNKTKQNKTKQNKTKQKTNKIRKNYNNNKTKQKKNKQPKRNLKRFSVTLKYFL